MKNGKQILIVFEGVDKSGKTTLLNAFNKATNFKYVVLDRGTISSKVYDKFFKRDRRAYYQAIEDAAFEAFKVVVVLCVAKPDTIYNRLLWYGEKLPKPIRGIAVVQNAFLEEATRASKDAFIMLDTGLESVEGCVRSLKRFVKALEKEDGLQ